MTFDKDAAQHLAEQVEDLRDLIRDDARHLNNLMVEFGNRFKYIYLNALKSSGNTRYRRMVNITELNPQEEKNRKEVVNEERKLFARCIADARKSLMSPDGIVDAYLQKFQSRLEEIADGASHRKS